MKQLSAHTCGVFSALGLLLLAVLILALNHSAAALVPAALALPLFFTYPLMMAKSFPSGKTGDVLYMDFPPSDHDRPSAA